MIHFVKTNLHKNMLEVEQQHLFLLSVEKYFLLSVFNLIYKYGPDQTDTKQLASMLISL